MTKLKENLRKHLKSWSYTLYRRMENQSWLSNVLIRYNSNLCLKTSWKTTSKKIFCNLDIKGRWKNWSFHSNQRNIKSKQRSVNATYFTTCQKIQFNNDNVDDGNRECTASNSNRTKYQLIYEHVFVFDRTFTFRRIR